MQTQHTSLLSRLMRLVLLLIVIMGAAACSVTDLILGEELPPIEATTVPPAFETPRPEEVVDLEDLSGQWVGTALLNDGSQIYYELDLEQEDADVRGSSRSSNEDGAASVSVRGTYADGHLNLEEYDGQTSGNWPDLCYWSLDLHTTGTSSEMRLVGSFKDLPNSAGTCTLQGEIALSRQ